MDQLKTQLAAVLKYGFWISCALVLLGSLGIWYWTTSKLAQESASQTQKIKSAIQTVSSVQSELDTHPNETSHQEMQRLIESRQEEVLTSWQTLYDRQRKILTWPVAELKQDFVDKYKDLIPIEVSIPFPPGELELETTYLDRYQRYIKTVLPKIAEIANAEWTAEFEKSSSMSMGMGMGMSGYGGMGRRGPGGMLMGVDEGPLVKWSTASQQALLSDLFPWRGEQPSTLEVYYSQENLWILKQLLQIIADVNGDAVQPYQAKIHEINEIGIGKSVSFGEGEVSKPGSTLSMDMAMGMGGMGGDMGMGMGMDDYESQMGMGSDMGMGLTTVEVDPADDRYVNGAMEPITGADLRSALTNNSPTTASLAVAKRVPVMMSLNMDQRSINELLAACGSAPLMVDVTQVRILPANPSSRGSGMGMGMDMGMGGEGSEMDMMGMGGMSMGGPTAPTAQNEAEFPFDMNVEIYGLIYIYNPPDREKLGLEQVTEDTVLDGASETVGGQPVAPQPSASQPAASGELPTPQPPADETPAAPTPAPAEDTPADSPPPASQPADDPPAPAETPPPPVAATPAGPPPASASSIAN